VTQNNFPLAHGFGLVFSLLILKETFTFWGAFFWIRLHASWVKYDEMTFNGVQMHFYKKPKRFSNLQYTYKRRRIWI